MQYLPFFATLVQFMRELCSGAGLSVCF